MAKPDVKHTGQVYTPERLVSRVLDFIGYKDREAIIGKHIIDNSCGNGAFLREVVKRYCTLSPTRKDLEKFIHGIEIDPNEAQKCRDNLTSIAKSFGIENVDWDIRTGDTLTISDYDNQMDYVVGNPPYIRVHNLGKTYSTVKTSLFTQKGMTDLYIAFFGIGFNMMAENGLMAYLTPSSWLTSNAGRELRRHIIETHNMSKLVDFGHLQLFDGVTTYPLLSVFDKREPHGVIDYYTFDENPYEAIYKSTLTYEEFNIDGKFYFSEYVSDLMLVRLVREHIGQPHAEVKIGFQTSANDIFMNDGFDFTSGTIKAIKASTGKWTTCIYPYDAQGSPTKLSDIERDNKPLYDYLKANEGDLRARDCEDKENWHLFARSQGIADVSKDKVVVNTLYRDQSDIKVNFAPAGTGVYGTAYIITHHTFDEVRSALLSDDFMRYVRLLRNYKQGGYYFLTSNDLELYLNYKLDQ